MIQVEAQLLRDAQGVAGDLRHAHRRRSTEFPDSYELLYDRAMAAERIDRLDVLEADLRKVIKMKPDYAHAYNALGYTLAEKTNRLAEAKDADREGATSSRPTIRSSSTASAGCYYRLGNLDEALKHLQSAYTARTDPEIAAHLGEVLWKAGQARRGAARSGSAALDENPSHETLLAVIQKYTAT